jgi:membrane-associated phospholipid phosphatase
LILYRFFSFALWVSFSFSIFANESPQKYEKKEGDSIKSPFTWYDWIANVPRDYSLFYHRVFRQEAMPVITLVAASTAILWFYDEELLAAGKKWGKMWSISQDDNMSIVARVGGFPIQMPTDKGTALYFIGDGWTHASIAGMYLSYGGIFHEIRALHTASQLAEAILNTGISTQVLKHLTGRESPLVSTGKRGVWRMLPDQKKYHQHVSSYDAYPSGHVATAMATMTVMAGNYPEYALAIQLAGYPLITLLALQMLNNGVHWASDYPLGLALGYTFGRIAVEHGKQPLPSTHATWWERTKLIPLSLGAAGYGVQMVTAF